MRGPQVYPTRLIEVPLRLVKPNKYSAKVEVDVRVQNLAAKIKQYGFTSTLVAYEQDNEFILLDGHRRRIAADLAGLQVVPVNVVPRPKSAEDERFIIAALRGEFRNWTKFEWGKAIYERWLRAGKPDVNVFALDAVVSTRFRHPKEITRVLQAFSKLPHDILERTRLDEIGFDTMLRVAEWVAQLEKRRPDVTDDIPSDTVARILVDKVDRKIISSNDLQKTSVFNLATEEQLKRLLGDQSFTLKRLLDEIGFDRKNTTDRHRAALVSLDRSREYARVLEPRTAEEWKGCITCLEQYEIELLRKINELERFVLGNGRKATRSTLFD